MSYHRVVSILGSGARASVAWAGCLVLILVAATAAGTEPVGTSEPERVVVVDPGTKPSDSPHLQLPEELRNVPPMLPPAGPIEGPLSRDPRATVEYNPATGEERIISSLEHTALGQPAFDWSSEPFSGLLPPGVEAKSVIGDDDRVLISPATSYPWRTVVKLFLTFPDSATGGCSGSIIGSSDGHGYHVLTAGHCVYSHSHGGWATSIKVVPALDNTDMPYNYAWATLFRSYTGWTNDGNSQHDWAMLSLDRNVGDFTGWMGRITRSSSDSIYTQTANVAGYPGDLSAGLRMYFDADSGHSADDYNHWYSMDTAGGMSGAPVWRYVSPDRWIMTIHTCGTGGCGIPSNSVNHGTRLNQNKYDMIVTWCDEDSPPTDRADLIDDGPAYSGFSPTSVERGVTQMDVWNDTRNVGTAASGSFYVRYYASTNTNITEYDYLLGSEWVSNISPFSWADTYINNITVPASVPPDTYYVGWIIDATSAVTEFDEDNNVAYVSGTQLTVVEPCSYDAYEPDNSSGSASVLVAGSYQTHSICSFGDHDWALFTIAEESAVTLWTFGTAGDSDMSLYNNGLGLIEYDDDDGANMFSLIDRECGIDPLAPGTYYVEVGERGDDWFIDPYTLSLAVAPCTDRIFSDGFERGNLSAWSNSVP